jgi:hypothetical protein
LFKLVRITYIYWPIECTPKTFIWGVVGGCKKLATSIGQLNALKNLHLNDCLKFKKITYIYWPIECTSKPSFPQLSKLAKIM